MLALSWVYFGIVYGLYALGFFLPTIIKGFAAQHGMTFSTAGIGLINSLGNLSGFVAPYVTGELSEATGDDRLGLWVVGICMVSAAAVAWTLRRSRSHT